MGKSKITDKDVAYQLARILLREVSSFKKPENMPLRSAVEQIVDTGGSPLIRYSSLVNEMNQIFNLENAKQKFTTLNIEQFLGMVLKDSIDFSYKIDGIKHKGKIRKKVGCDLPVTVIVVNAKTNIPNKRFFSYFDLPCETEQQMRQTTVELLETLLSFQNWDVYQKRMKKVFS